MQKERSVSTFLILKSVLFTKRILYFVLKNFNFVSTVAIRGNRYADFQELVLYFPTCSSSVSCFYYWWSNIQRSIEFSLQFKIRSFCNLGKTSYYVKIVRIWSFSGPYFPAFWVSLIISPYSVRMRENTDKENSEYGHFSRSVC